MTVTWINLYRLQSTKTVTVSRQQNVTDSSHLTHYKLIQRCTTRLIYAQLFPSINVNHITQKMTNVTEM